MAMDEIPPFEYRTAKGRHPFPFRIYEMEKDGTVDLSKDFIGQHITLPPAKRSLYELQRQSQIKKDHSKFALMMWDGKGKWTRYLSIVRRDEVQKDMKESHYDENDFEYELLEIGMTRESIENLKAFVDETTMPELVAALKLNRKKTEECQGTLRYSQTSSLKERSISATLRRERNELDYTVKRLRGQLRNLGEEPSD